MRRFWATATQQLLPSKQAVTPNSQSHVGKKVLVSTREDKIFTSWARSSGYLHGLLQRQQIVIASMASVLLADFGTNWMVERNHESRVYTHLLLAFFSYSINCL